MPPEQEKILYHGTTYGRIKRADALYGYIRPQEPGMSGNMTDDYKTAAVFARLASCTENGDMPIILHIKLSNSEIVELGKMTHTNKNTFGLTKAISAELIPEDFFSKTPFLKKPIALQDEADGYVTFYIIDRSKIINSTIVHDENIT
ncbi:MAG: hypothetical protein V1858_02980 [Candidatus Gottesmanbacteria bacterium]